MDTTMEAFHELRARFARDSVDIKAGIIRGVTVAKAGVQAEGKFVMLDVNGQVTKDEKLSRKRLPVFTDGKTLDTLMTAAAAAGNRVKTREDHDDRIGARAGMANAFKREGDAVKVDVNLYDSYRNRPVVLETADKDPDHIGLSIDFTPTWEILPDRALMRVSELTAVDIVDAGAITPGGLFLRAGVDTGDKRGTAQNKNHAPMAAPSIEQLMEQVTGMAKALTECQASIAKMAAPPPAKKDGDDDGDAMRAGIKEIREQLAVAKLGEQLSAVQKSVVEMRRERALLGFRGNDADRVRLAGASVEDIEAASGAVKSYLQLVADFRTKNAQMRASDAHDAVLATPEGKRAYGEHLASKGVIKRETMAV